MLVMLQAKDENYCSAFTLNGETDEVLSKVGHCLMKKSGVFS